MSDASTDLVDASTVKDASSFVDISQEDDSYLWPSPMSPVSPRDKAKGKALELIREAREMDASASRIQGVLRGMKAREAAAKV